ncbi:hypothetical protein M9434_000445 [Picochlorum sp. BPE23]|nr:hypothetical protein M9434_000445 [Picochlorum sp. BPE23]
MEYRTPSARATIGDVAASPHLGLNCTNRCILQSIMRRSLVGGTVPLTRFISHLTTSGRQDGSIICDAPGIYTSPVFAMKFASRWYRGLLAMGDESGYVSIVRAHKKPPAMLSDSVSDNMPAAQWRGHNTAIFDLSWAENDTWMYTASGDFTVNLWDTGYAKRIATFSGGPGSNKALSVHSENAHVFASAGRHGHVFLYDARLRGFGTSGKAEPIVQYGAEENKPVLKLEEAHSCDSPHSSVTSLCFLRGMHSSVVASGGQDGSVKLWDVRYDASPVVEHHPLMDRTNSMMEALSRANRTRSMYRVATMSQPPLGGRTLRGVTSLALHPDGTRLLVSYTGGHHLLFDVNRPQAGPIQWFGGHSVESFYVKSDFSPDGTHFMSGSSDNNVYIWSLDDKNGTEPIVLEGHEKEVTAVAWNPDNIFQAASAGDDHVVKMWSVNVQQQEEEFQEYDPYKIIQARREGRRHETPDSMSTPQPTVSAMARLEPSPSTIRRLKVSNALRESALKPQKKVSKQPTLAQVLKRRNGRKMK